MDGAAADLELGHRAPGRRDSGRYWGKRSDAGTGYFTSWNPYFRRNVRVSVRPEDRAPAAWLGDSARGGSLRWSDHLHLDHDGGLHHFPNAEILVSREEHRIATGPLGKVAGYLPQRWPPWFAPRLVDLNPEPFGSFPRSLTLTAEGGVRLVGTEGHSAGHVSVIVSEDARCSSRETPLTRRN